MEQLLIRCEWCRTSFIAVVAQLCDCVLSDSLGGSRTRAIGYSGGHSGGGRSAGGYSGDGDDCCCTIL